MCYNGYLDKKTQWGDSELIIKIILSLDHKLKLIYVKLESPVIVYHHVTVNLLTSQVHTARQAIGIGREWR